MLKAAKKMCCGVLKTSFPQRQFASWLKRILQTLRRGADVYYRIMAWRQRLFGMHGGGRSCLSADRYLITDGYGHSLKAFRSVARATQGAQQARRWCGRPYCLQLSVSPAVAYLRTSSGANVGADKDSDEHQRLRLSLNGDGVEPRRHIPPTMDPARSRNAERDSVTVRIRAPRPTCSRHSQN